jgi:hypothetical protein
MNIMKSTLKRVIRKIAPGAFLGPEGDVGITKKGHRGYVGGMWDEIGTLQFDFLLSAGLKPDSHLLDIACGSLRLGVKAIPYLERSHYLGIEKESGLVKAGLEKELDPKVREEKEPNIVISDSFEFEKLGQKADFAIAQSLFTHLPPSLIDLCFKKLSSWLEDDGVFYATFFQTERKIDNPEKPHDHGYFAYTRTEMCGIGERNGFASNYIGDWNHPRNQVIVEYRKKLTNRSS